MVRRRARKAMVYFAIIVVLCVVNVSYGFSGGDIYEDKVILFQAEAYKVNQTVVVHENATLTVEPGVKIVFSANATMIVYGTLVANGTETSQIMFTSIADNTSSVQDELLFKPRSARLVDGNGYNEGRLEVLYNGVWGTVCNDGWTTLNSRVACQELGFDGGNLTGKFGTGTGTIWMDDVRCRESDYAVIECAHRGFGSHNCGHWQDVGLVCTGILLPINGRLQTLQTPTIQFARRPNTTKQESSLINVKIDEDKQHWMLNSSSGTAIVCDKLCPYMENITISSFFKAIEIHDSRHILLNDIVIQNCTYGINAIDSPADNLTTNRFERNGGVNTLFCFSRIKVYGCHLAIGMFSQSYDAIKLEDIDITECNFGIAAQRFTVVESSQHSVPGNKSSMASFHIQGTRIYKSKTGIYLYNLFTTAFSFTHVDIVDCVYGIILTKTQTSKVKTEGILLQTGITGIIIEDFPTLRKQIDLCNGTTRVTLPEQVQVNKYSYYSKCRQVFTAKSGHVLHVYVKVVDRGNLMIFHRNESDLLLNVNSTNWREIDYARSSGNEITVETNFYGRATLYIVSRSALFENPGNTISRAVIRGFSQSGIVLRNAFQSKEESPFERRNRADNNVVIENVLISNCGHGIEIADGSQIKLAFRNITLQRNQYGLLASSGKIFLKKCYIMENSYGIYLTNSRSLEMNECLIKGGNIGIHVRLNAHGSFYLYNSHIIGANYGIYMDYTHSTPLIGRIINCSLTDHRYTAIYSYWLSGLNISIFHSLFERNRQIVLFSYPYYYRNFDVYFHIQQCTISFTQSDVLQFSFSNSAFSSDKIVVRNNTFTRNVNTIIKLEHQGHVSNTNIMMIEKNMFINNTFPASGNGIFEITGNSQLVRIINNQFLNNKCTFLAKFTTWTSPGTTALEFINNIMEENTGLQQNFEETRYINLTSFSLGVFGCYFRSYTFHHNTFNNGRMDAELFIGSGCGTNYYHNGYEIDARFNWWGTSTVAEIKNRIFDFNDWNDRAKVTFLPAATSRNFSDFSGFVAASRNLSFIGGYLNSSVELTIRNSPYIVTSDLTVSQNAVLTINAGVELHFYPRVGVLVFGSMFSIGTRNHPIRFCSFSKRCKSVVLPKKDIIRLTGRNLGESGKLEILVGSTWKVICYSNFNLKAANVACRQLGYGKSRFFTRYYGLSTSLVYAGLLNCSGGESSILDCPTTSLSYCHSYYGVHLECDDHSGRWGNIRISSHGENMNHAFGNVEQSILQNIQLDHSGALHRYAKAVSIQVINGSPSIKHVTITNGNGIEIISPHSLVELENLTFTDSYWSPAISILGNRGSVEVTRCNISKSRYGGLVIAPIESLTFFQPYFGFSDLCDPFLKISVNNFTYIYFDNNFLHGWTQCAKELSSPKNTTLVFRLVPGSFSVDSHSSIYLFDGNTSRSSQIASLHFYYDYWLQRQYLYKEFKSSSNSMYLQADLYGFSSFLAEVKVLYNEEKTFGFQRQNQAKCKIVESTFQENVASAIHYSSDSRTSTNLTITRNHFISSKHRDNPLQSVINISASNNDNIEISNNFIHDNSQGGIYIKSKSNQVKGTIVNNVITFNINGSEAILVEAQNGSFAQFVLTGNDLRRNDIKYPKDLVKITNVWATIKENIFFDNTMRYVLNWELESPGVVNQTNGYCLRNKFLRNNGSLRHTVVIKGTQKILHYNIFINPANRFELSTLPSNDADVPIDARHNWWGHARSWNISKRIKDRRLAQDLPVVIFEPFLTSVPEVFPTGLCSFGWILFGNTCYFYRSGAQAPRCPERGRIRKGKRGPRMAPLMIITSIFRSGSYHAGTRLAIYI